MNKQLDIRRENRPKSLFDLMTAFDDLFNVPPMSSFSRLLTDVQENDEAYVLSVDMPGVNKEDIQIQVEGNRLTISAEKQAEKNTQENYSRHYRRYQQSFTLPNTVLQDKIEASYENGVLDLFIPKSEQAQAKKVEIQSGKGGFLSRLTGKAGEKKEAAEGKSVKH